MAIVPACVTGLFEPRAALRACRKLLDIILPTSCTYCNSPVGESKIPFFCTTCWADFAVMQVPLCPGCGKPFDSPEALTFSGSHVCLQCRKDPPVFDQALSIGQFEGSLREAIHLYKYRPCRSLGKPLAAWMTAHLRFSDAIDLVMPVPLHISRLRYRGFNQALLLAAPVARAAFAPLCFDNLVRIKATRPQVELSGRERLENVAGAFALKHADTVAGRKILLIDDVFTSGATMNECSRVLKKAGADRVYVLTLARAV